MNILRLTLNPLQKLLRDRDPESWHDITRCQYVGSEGNGFVRQAIEHSTGKGLCVAKMGTVELRNLVAFIAESHTLKCAQEIYYYLRDYQSLFPVDTFAALCHNAGFFPLDITLGNRWSQLCLNDLPEVDILGSYQRLERRLEKQLKHAVKIDIHSYLAPYLFEHPWTEALRGKRVLVVSPFTDSICQQYERRQLLFDNSEVLPKFADLLTIKAVQSIAGTQTQYADWFEALQTMKDKMSSMDYDIALIGCGAYGMHLAVHAKRMGRIGIHTAGWTQMLFGVYGNRWLNDEPQFKRFINQYWVRPSAKETPANAQTIENGCYW